jgi:phosphoglycerate kinase
VGKSLYEEDLVETARELKAAAQKNGGDIPVPTDVICGKEFSETAEAVTMNVEDVADDDMIFDIGPKSIAELCEVIKNAGTIVWNGPVGVFEFDQFGSGTKAISMAIAESNAFSVAGGGDTLAAVDKYDIADKVSYISTGGGSFLEFLEGKELPVVAMLEARAKG